MATRVTCWMGNFIKRGCCGWYFETNINSVIDACEIIVSTVGNST